MLQLVPNIFLEMSLAVHIDCAVALVEHAVTARTDAWLYEPLLSNNERGALHVLPSSLLLFPFTRIPFVRATSAYFSKDFYLERRIPACMGMFF